MFLPKTACAFVLWPHPCQVLVSAEGFKQKRSCPQVTWAESSNSVWIVKGNSCAHSSVMIGYQSSSGVREGIRKITWSREFKETRSLNCLFICSINRGFSSEEWRYFLFIYFPWLTDYQIKANRGHIQMQLPQSFVFMPLLGTLHLCLLPLLNLSHKSQGYVGDQNQILQLLPTAPYLISNLARSKSWPDPSGLFSEVGLQSLSS